MKTRIETITASNSPEFAQYQESLANAYIEAFAGEPWNERSRCENNECSVHFSAADAGSICIICGNSLIPAYTQDQMVEEWSTKLLDQDAMFELAINENNEAVRATIALPLTLDDMVSDRYKDAPAMQEWARGVFPNNFVWIEDTFADRRKSPSGNMRDRGATLARIALNYPSINRIGTRTKASEILASTLRDAAAQTDVYLGQYIIPLRNSKIHARNIGTVPDEGTFLVVHTDEF
jgi:hypothetical protein